MCFTLTNTSPQISEDSVPMITRGAEGQQRSEIAEEGTEEFTGSIQCDIQTEELPPQHAELLSRPCDSAESCTTLEAPLQSSSPFVIPPPRYSLLRPAECCTFLLLVTMSPLSLATISFRPGMLPLAFVLIIVSLLVMTSLIRDPTLILFHSIDP